MGCDGREKKDGFTVSTVGLLRGSLAQKLIPIVDRVRDINTILGTRPYRVHIIRTRYAGPRRGMGVETVVHSLELLPTPLVVDMRSLAEMVTPVGVSESGTVQLQYISGRYTEEQLIGVGPDGEQIPDNEAVYYEIEFFRRDGRPAERRRFIRDTVPSYNASQVQWLVSLVSALEDRSRSGTPG